MPHARFVRVLALALALRPQAAVAADDYQLGPDSAPRPGVPRGTLTKQTFTASKVFPGTRRDYWIYVPSQYAAGVAACVMVFQDGERFARLDGAWRVPVVFDNLIHARAMPVTIGVFVDPGVLPPLTPDALPRYNRSYEYDATTPDYARFLLDELLPEVAKTYTLSSDPDCRAIGGSSSGGIAAFVAAWQRPDAFHRVFSSVGSFVGLRGGDSLPTLVRKTEPKPLRLFLQDGSADQNIYGGDWWIANQAMLSALGFAGYQVEHAWGDGGHTARHGGAVFPAALRWLWKDFPAHVQAGVGSKQPVLDIVGTDAGAAWQLVGEGYQFAEGPAANAVGELFFTDVKAARIHRVAADGKVSVFVADSGGANGMTFGPDGRLYAAQSARKRVVAYDGAGRETVLADGIDGNDLAVSRAGFVWVTEHPTKRIWVISPRGEKRVVDTGIALPNGVVLSPDQSLLYVADTRGRVVHSFQVLADGSLANREAWCALHAPEDRPEGGADGLAVDVEGRLYVASALGVQICDQAGRVIAILPPPQPRATSNVEFGGPSMNELYVTSGDRVYRRITKTKGVRSADPPIKPPPPKL
jgi:gluconolactonase